MINIDKVSRDLGVLITIYELNNIKKESAYLSKLVIMLDNYVTRGDLLDIINNHLGTGMLFSETAMVDSQWRRVLYPSRESLDFIRSVINHLETPLCKICKHPLTDKNPLEGYHCSKCDAYYTRSYVSNFLED